MWAVVTLLLSSGPSTPTWALFPEGTTELREDLRNNLSGTRRRVVTRVTRTGQRVVVSIESTETGPHLVESPVRAEASSLSAPALSPDGQRFDFRCVKKTQRVHSPDMTFLPPDVSQECDGGFVRVTSRRPKQVVVVVCRVDHEDADAPRLTFAPGQVIERVFENNDCTLAEGLRFVDPAPAR